MWVRRSLVWEKTKVHRIYCGLRNFILRIKVSFSIHINKLWAAILHNYSKLQEQPWRQHPEKLKLSFPTTIHKFSCGVHRWCVKGRNSRYSKRLHEKVRNRTIEAFVYRKHIKPKGFEKHLHSCPLTLQVKINHDHCRRRRLLNRHTSAEIP